VAEPVVLATGFSVFPGAPENPTAWAMEEIERSGWRPEGARLVTRTLAVAFDVWEKEYGALLEATRPHAAVGFGLSARASGIQLESTARNQLTMDRPDALGARAASSQLTQEGAAVFPTALPFAAIAGALQAARIPLGRSDDAGDYICNLLFYRLMAHAATHGPAVAGFVHVPSFETLDRERSLAGIKIVIEECARAVNAKR
jgi:pyroglutamyl-peptidase